MQQVMSIMIVEGMKTPQEGCMKRSQIVVKLVPVELVNSSDLSMLLCISLNILVHVP